MGVGASAGGLEAFTQLLKALPVDTGMAFVLVQHLAPTHASALSEILSRATTMPVQEVQDEVAAEPNQVYVIPPGQDMVISGGALQLMAREGHRVPRPVDLFFRALAEDRGHQAIGVVLSGTASDGTAGLEAIKSEGGLTFAQDATAQHQGMPQSAIASGCVDFVLPPDQIAREIARIGRHPHTTEGSQLPGQENAADLAPIVQVLHHATGIDFTHYKFNTLYRRITRRMILQKMDGLNEYVRFLRRTPAEVDGLHHDILIGVTSFFRNPEAFEALKQAVFPRLCSNRSRAEPLRMWTIGCSTGQEAYSLAIAFTEFAEAEGIRAPLQLFATDLNAASLVRARAGVFSKEIAEEVSPERLGRFFTDVDGSYRISKVIRDSCVFSQHNVLADPPFSRIDLISCRNLLIYLEPPLQQRVVATVHYALKPSGCLWVGNAETTGDRRKLFETVDRKHKIFSKRPGTSPGFGNVPREERAAPQHEFTPGAVRPHGGATDLPREADRLLLSKFAPPGVLVSDDLEILQYRGDTAPYLAPAPGKASLSLLKMLREGLLVPVRAAVLQAGKQGAPVREEAIRVESEGGPRKIAVEVIPVPGDGRAGGGFLILFDDGATPRARRQSRGKEPRPEAGAAASEAARLARELSATREYLQTVIEQQDAANEELQSANEEVQSANEELQSANEELETSKEEIESSNEELATVNDELNHRDTELNQVNTDLENLLGSVQLAVIMIGPDLRVRRFTPEAVKALDLAPTDIGRPLGQIRLPFELPDLELLVTEVLETGNALEREVGDQEGHWYSLRLRPYRTSEGKIDGVVAMLVDVTEMKRAHEFTASIVATVREPLLVLDAEMRVQTASRSFYEGFRTSPEATEGQSLYAIGNRRWDIPALRRLLEEVLPKSTQIRDFVVEFEFETDGKRTMLLNARRLVQTGDRSPAILLAIEDVTEQRQTANLLRQNAADLSESDRHKNEFLAILAHELRNPLAPIRHALQIMRLTGDYGEPAHSASEMIERQVSQIVRLVDDLLDVSRVSRGKIELRKGRVELAAAVNHAVDAARSACESRDIELTVTLPPQPVYLDADPTRLAQVVGNLLHNACKFTDVGGSIELTVEREDGEAVISVRDSGIGIPAAQLPLFFDMFVQVDTTLERTVGGLGLGLTLVKNLVELHGGTVEARSAGLGHGSEFIVRLPIVIGAPELPPWRAVGEPKSLTARRILVVDDNRDSAESLAMLLKLTGNETHLAYDGPDAVDAAAAFRPDVVLLDIGLPKLNGYAVARKIREEPWGKDMLLVALTGWGQEEDRQKSRAAGFNGHLVKPVHYSTLIELLADLLAAGHAN